MSDYKMVPVVATEEMFRAAQEAEMDHDEFEDWMYFSGRQVAKQYAAMLAAAPPFVVTDEVVMDALRAYEGKPWRTWFDAADVAGMRAAIEAVLGGGA